ncbi:hypothetical protein [Turneriella parva]|uniref:Uncharacterized protein n=1 Tax=Turneriella parva (strain ATCC BAA-1111 / DSM 21527 / NCTC 11395 / H) TaxID=869212 RepID=I4B1P9_TURPD|nr:hypothetical protein [Turneriella parva]AFM11206.1 hypothetical protein Turpa_0554 [Turneriella parva DSM 21527]
MKTAGAILALVLAIFGSIIALADLWSDKAALTALLGLSFLSVQFILGIVSFFKAKAAGMGIIVTSAIMVVISLLTSAKFTGFVELLMLGGGVMVLIGAKKDAN